jgi:hypothetical protein
LHRKNLILFQSHFVHSLFALPSALHCTHRRASSASESLFYIQAWNFCRSSHLPSSSQGKHSPSSEHSLRPGEAEPKQKLAYLSRQRKSVVSISIMSIILYTNARILNFKRFLATDLRKEEAGNLHAQCNNSRTFTSFRLIISESVSLMRTSVLDTKCLLHSFLFETFFVVVSLFLLR